MLLSPFNWFNEVGYSIEVSSKVYDLIYQELTHKIMLPLQLDKIMPDRKIGIGCTTGKNTKQHLEVWGAYHKAQWIEHIIWLPYATINQAENYLAEFLKQYFEGLVQVFSYYNVPEEAIRKIQQIVEAEVINNPAYEFHDPLWMLKDLIETNKKEIEANKD